MKTVALLARTPGFLVLRDALAGMPGIELAAVFTHGRLPKAEGGGERADTARYRDVCDRLGVPLHVVDFPEAKDIGPLLPEGPLDLLVSLSWRFVVPAGVLGRFGRAVNIHRGQLPRYAGAIPVQRAIEAGETRIAITAHVMTPEIDAGEILAEAWHDIAPLPPGVTPEAYAETVKADLEPLYAPLVRRVLGA